MLSQYRGASNTREVFQFLIGEKIKAVFQDNDNHVLIVTESGPALAFGSIGAPECGPSYWVVPTDEVLKLVEARRKEIGRKQAELRDMAGIKFDEGQRP